MATGSDGRLTNQHYVQLARAISSRDMETIAQGYLGIDIETIVSLKDEHRGNAEAFNRDVLNRWARKHPDGNQIKVSVHCISIYFSVPQWQVQDFPKEGALTLLFWPIFPKSCMWKSLDPEGLSLLLPLDPLMFWAVTDLKKFNTECFAQAVKCGEYLQESPTCCTRKWRYFFFAQV